MAKDKIRGPRKKDANHQRRRRLRRSGQREVVVQFNLYFTLAMPSQPQSLDVGYQPRLEI